MLFVLSFFLNDFKAKIIPEVKNKIISCPPSDALEAKCIKLFND